MLNKIKNSASYVLSPYKSGPLRSLHLMSEDMYSIGAISEDEMKETDKYCLKRKKVMSPRMKKIALTLAVLGLVTKVIEVVRVYRSPTRG